MNKIKVNFTFDRTILSCEKGTPLSQVCAMAGYEQNLVCGGHGKCKKCAVTIKRAGITQKVLSCQYKVTEDIDVLSMDGTDENKISVLTANSEAAFKADPPVRLLKLTTSDIRSKHCASITEIPETRYALSITHNAARSLSFLYNPDEADKEYGFVVYGDEIIDTVDGGEHIYAAAADIGTTTVALYIYDMEDLTLRGTYSALNSQTALGADVISRIGYCIDNENGTEILRGKITDTINELLDKAAADGVNTNRIYTAALCGNSTMQHLFMGFYPENLGKVPFSSVTMQTLRISGKDSLLNVNKNAVISFLPLLGGFVGADTTSVLVSLPQDSKARLMIDLGTNGEIAAGMNDKYTVASTACGPALEGAGLSCGMRAACGAIEHFKINRDKTLDIKVIGDVSPKGICGSGIIDILAELLRNKVINSRGRMLSRDDYEKEFGCDALSERIHEENGLRYFLLADKNESGNGENVYFSIKDVRQIQLAKAAIYTGCEMTAEILGKESLTEICLAGAFGNYINIENAQYIGLLPSFEGVPIRGIGNGAGTGAQMYILDKSVSARCEAIRKNAEHIELNFNDSFQQTYFDNMLFKNA